MDVQRVQQNLFLVFYGGVTVWNVIACCYLMFRKGNAIAPNITPPVRLRRWTAAFFAAMALSHVWYMPMYILTPGDDAYLSYLVGGMLDVMVVLPLAIVVLLVMLQDRPRPLWPASVMVAPLGVAGAWCVATRSVTVLPFVYAYFLLMCIGIMIFMVRETRRYGCWLHDNYADLEHKEVWLSHTLLILFLLMLAIYGFTSDGPSLFLLRIADFVMFGLLLWRVETLPQLDASDTSDALDASDALQEIDSPEQEPQVVASPPSQQPMVPSNIGQLLEENCEKTGLYLLNDLTLVQLSAAIGVNRTYLSQYFSSLGMNYNAYINDLRVNHFIRLYEGAIAAKQPVTAQQLAQECGYRSYSTFSLAFKQRMDLSVTVWMHDVAQDMVE